MLVVFYLSSIMEYLQYVWGQNHQQMAAFSHTLTENSIGCQNIALSAKVTLSSQQLVLLVIT